MVCLHIDGDGDNILTDHGKDGSTVELRGVCCVWHGCGCNKRRDRRNDDVEDALGEVDLCGRHGEEDGGWMKETKRSDDALEIRFGGVGGFVLYEN